MNRMLVALVGLSAGLARGETYLTIGYPLLRVDGQSLLLDFPAVQQELDLTQQQISKLKDLAQELKTTASKLDMPGKKAAVDKIHEINIQGAKAAIKMLTPEQIRRLEQIQLQIAGPYGFVDQEVAERLKLTVEQRRAIRKAYNDGRYEALKESLKPRKAKVMTEFDAASMAKIMELLNEEQKREYSRMLGTRAQGLPIVSGPVLAEPKDR